MNTAHYPHWPAGLPFQLTPPQTSVYKNLEVSALRYPDKAALVFNGSSLNYGTLKAEVDQLAGYLQKVCGVKRGDRVLLQMQNSPQFVIAFYAILRADAVIVPVNPMLLQEELRHVVEDSGARLALSASDLLAQIAPLLDSTPLDQIIVACHADYQHQKKDALSDRPASSGTSPEDARITRWDQALKADQAPLYPQNGPEDLACLPYTSGTTGKPKGCMHTHRSMMFTAVSGATWAGGASADHVVLVSLPLFHVTGMQIGMNAAIYAGATMILMARWDRDLAGRLITAHKVSSWSCIPTMMIDFLSNPALRDYEIGSLRRVSGGGAAMPAAIAQKLFDLTGLRYMEAYGLTETIATTHANPLQRLRQQCLGIPIFNVDSRVIDPDSLRELAPHEMGEIVIHGPQVFAGYWGDEQKSREAFTEIDGKSFFRTGDLGYRDEEGFFFYTDRLKRMINASGYKVWPAELESILYQHPAIQECCIIAAFDEYRGETVKAVVVRKPGMTLSADELMAWSRQYMAAYKLPRQVSFVDALPKSATGKIMWRQMQEKEMKA